MSSPPISCHVLDTTTGRPATAVAVTLTLIKPLGPSTPFTATTDQDGRVRAWNNEPGPPIEEVIASSSAQASAAPMVWSLKFDTGSYFGIGQTFFPEVEVKILVAGGAHQHYHVPLLLGPYSYTTYRGS
ncbi:MAG: hypothetical protein M1838_006236 [Thelocarpon superellum]|nr:MAG: hypothetical protein M1838_006236 [Thelocarpon superellum]